jgi:hypothetical protein
MVLFDATEEEPVYLFCVALATEPGLEGPKVWVAQTHAYSVFLYFNPLSSG